MNQEPALGQCMNIQYNKIADEYAKYRSSDAAVVENLIVQSGISAASNVLEIGCGTGNYISEIQKRVGCRCSGVDPAQEMIAEAVRRNVTIEYQVASAEHLGLPEGVFDLAFSADVIHHVEDRAAYFREVFRMLKPAGLLATVTDSEDTIRRRMPLAHYFPDIIAHELKRYPTVEQLRRYAEQARFDTAGEEVVETAYALIDAEKYRRKAFSCLRLISDRAFASGIARMTGDLENGPIQCVSRNFILWNRKPHGSGHHSHE